MQSKSPPSQSSQSNQADDECSASGLSGMGPDVEREASPEYEGEDTRLTSKKELAGFYIYGWAAEVEIHDCRPFAWHLC